MVPQQWLVHTTAPGVEIRGHAAGWSPLLRRDPRFAFEPGRATYPELAAGGARSLRVLGCEVGGRWHEDAVKLVRRLVAAECRRLLP